MPVRESLDSRAKPQGPWVVDQDGKCAGCGTLAWRTLPKVHCPFCCYVWKTQLSRTPGTCARCKASLWRWQQKHPELKPPSDRSLSILRDYDAARPESPQKGITTKPPEALRTGRIPDIA